MNKRQKKKLAKKQQSKSIDQYFKDWYGIMNKKRSIVDTIINGELKPTDVTPLTINTIQTRTKYNIVHHLLNNQQSMTPKAYDEADDFDPTKQTQSVSALQWCKSTDNRDLVSINGRFYKADQYIDHYVKEQEERFQDGHFSLNDMIRLKSMDETQRKAYFIDDIKRTHFIFHPYIENIFN